MEKIQLDDYSIFTGDVIEACEVFLSGRNYPKKVVIVDENTRVHCLPKVTEVIKPDHIIQIESGEIHKGLPTCEDIWVQMIDVGCDRHSLVINLGGGVIGDMGGFAASCYMRGVDFIQIPTTLLSQVDASVGGKLAVDFKGLKNIIGMFQNPRAVIVDPSFLETLPVAEQRSGYAEMIKHALIADDSMWMRLTNKEGWTANISLTEIVESIKVKQKVVSNDPTEKGLRKILNFGHTVGHAIESASFAGDNPFLHGEAIALGMVVETHLSLQLQMMEEDECQKVWAYLKGVYGDISVQGLSKHEEILDILRKDKKHKGGEYSFSLLDRIGHCAYDVVCDDEMIRESLDFTQQYWS